MTITNFSNMSRMNQRVLTTNCLKIIFILQYLVLWQKKKKYETKDKKENNELLNVIKRGFIDLKNKIKEMSED